jgi:hypothetical protein
MIDHIPNWDTAVWINIATSVSVAICVATWIVMGWVRRGRLNTVHDAERDSSTFVLLGLIAFFLSRAMDVGRAGMTIATPWLLGAGVFLSLSSIACTVIVLMKHDDYGVLRQPEWKNGDPERRTGPADRRKVTQ